MFYEVNMETGTWTQTVAIIGSFIVFALLQWAVVKKDVSRLEASEAVHNVEITAIRESIRRVEERSLTQMDDINKKLDDIVREIKGSKCPYSNQEKK